MSKKREGGTPPEWQGIGTAVSSLRTGLDIRFIIVIALALAIGVAAGIFGRADAERAEQESLRHESLASEKGLEPSEPW